MSEAGYAVAYRALHVFQGRKGFDDWWDSIDSQIQEEIIDELAIVVEE